MLGFYGDMTTVDTAPARLAIAAHHRPPEAAALAPLLDEASLPAEFLVPAQALAARLAEGVRAARHKAGGVDALMLEFSLDSREGIALMCLAEALLRIPDTATRDRLIRDKLAQGDWRAHVGRSPSLFVNAAAWGLLVTGKLVDSRSDGSLEQALASLLRKGGEPLIRKGVDLAMRLLGQQFVLGRTIAEALANAREREARGYRFSFDMLGEAAMTDEDARHYLAAYEDAIHAIGRGASHAGVYEGAGISIKLSALHPRYARSQRDRVMAELYPRVRGLAQLARGYDIGLNIDAEEADRLDLSLDLFERLASEPALEGWLGLGFVVQAYQKRARSVIDWLVELARARHRRLMVRLVKGAYWDTEVKRAQVDGLSDYPVFTRKVHTDVSYLACAKAMLAAPDALYPQFATHNAFTIAAVHTMAGNAHFEFQCLHGMGESVYDQVVGDTSLRRPCRIYAPVGSHETLLAYLVRRLLENGANSSFVNRIVDPSVDIAELVADPVARARLTQGTPHPRIPRPVALYPDRRNSRGRDFSDERTVLELESFMASPLVPEHARPTGATVRARASAAHRQPGGPARDRRHRRGGRRSRCRTRRRRRGSVAVAAGGRRPPRGLPRARCRPDRGARARTDAPRRPRGGQVARERARRSPRSRGFLPVLRGASAARVARHDAARPDRKHCAVEFPPGHLRRAGQRGTCRRQSRHREAGGANAADCRIRRASLPRGRRTRIGAPADAWCG